VESEWGITENNRRAKFYAIGKAGRRQLRSEAVELRRYFEALCRALDTA